MGAGVGASRAGRSFESGANDRPAVAKNYAKFAADRCEISPLAIARLEGIDVIRHFPCAADPTRIRKIEPLNQSDTTVVQAKIRSHRVDGLSGAISIRGEVADIASIACAEDDPG